MIHETLDDSPHSWKVFGFYGENVSFIHKAERWDTCKKCSGRSVVFLLLRNHFQWIRYL